MSISGCYINILSHYDSSMEHTLQINGGFYLRIDIEVHLECEIEIVWNLGVSVHHLIQ